SSQLESVKSFEDLGLKPDILKGLYAMNFSKPSKIQESALPLLLKDPPMNMIGQSQSGTGKTAAFSLNILNRIDPHLAKPQAIVLSPSRELARQTVDVIQQMARFTDITTCLVVKDGLHKNRNVTEHVIVGTPGSVMDSIRRRHVRTEAVKVFVLDEADNMLDQDGLGDQSIRIKGLIASNPQIVLFSATFPENVRRFAPRFAPDANEISLRREELSVDSIKQFYMDCQSEEHKYEVLCQLYDLLTVSQSIIFCKRRETADEIARRMTEQGHAVLSLHGMMSPEERDQVMDYFRRGEAKVLITTNVIARGIDILQVSLVVNYDMPLDNRGNPDPETYLHRVGRTGRFGRTGVSINFVHDRRSWEQMRAIEEHFQRTITRVPTDDWENVERLLKPSPPVSDIDDETPQSEAVEEGLLDEYPLDSTELDVIHQRISNVPALNLQRFTRLERLCLRQNLILDIRGFEGLSLTELDLYDNKISHIRNLSHLTTLTYLDLSFNKIKHIGHLEELVNLTDLFLVSNRISKIENLDTLVNLDNLELGANRVIENLDKLVHLTKLWLGKNKITRLQNLSPLRNLRILSIQSNRITKIEGLEELLNLEELYLSHNAIEKLEGLEHNLKLKTIDVAANKLTHIENVSHLKHLEDFWANNNLFGKGTFEELTREFGETKTLETIYLEGSPMQLENRATYRNKVRLALPQIKQIDATYV
ncbi:P-loop containing nucleoside triphosphate hydrolase protein, partial [Dichotomocladium elegans]